MNKTAFTLIAWLSIIGPAAFSGEAPKTKPPAPASGTVIALTLEDCIDLAFLRSLQFRRNILADMRTEADLYGAWARWTPTFTTAYTAANDGTRNASVALSQATPLGTVISVGGNAAEGGPAGPGTAASVTVSQPLLRGFGPAETLAELRSRRIDRMRSQAALERQAQDLVDQVKGSVFGIVGDQETVIVRERSVEASRKNVEIVQAQFDQKVKAKADLSRARIQLADREIALEQSRAQLAADLDSLKALLDLPISGAISLKYEAPFEAKKLDVDALLSEAFKERLDLITSRLDQAKRVIDLDQARRRALWDIQLSATVTRGGTGDTLGQSFRFENDTTWTAGVAFNYPFGQISDRAALARARYDLESQQLAVRDMVNGITAEVRRIVRGVDLTAATVRNLEIKLAAAKEDVEATRELYGVGRVTSFELTSVEDGELSAQVDLIGAKLSYMKQLADLDRAVGRSTGRVPKPPFADIDEAISAWIEQPAPQRFDLIKWLSERRKPK